MCSATLQISIPAPDISLDDSKGNKLWSMLTMMDRFLDSFLVGKSVSQKETLVKPGENTNDQWLNDSMT
jgi:hypothetical protein